MLGLVAGDAWQFPRRQGQPSSLSVVKVSLLYPVSGSTARSTGIEVIFNEAVSFGCRWMWDFKREMRRRATQLAGVRTSERSGQVGGVGGIEYRGGYQVVSSRVEGRGSMGRGVVCGYDLKLWVRWRWSPSSSSPPIWLRDRTEE